MKKFESKAFTETYLDGLIIDPQTIVEYAKTAETHEEVLSVLEKLNKAKLLDSFDAVFLDYLKMGFTIPHWQYVDSLTCLFSASRLLQAKNYLEIGVRQGRSASCVVAGNPQVNIYAFDMWVKDYAGVENSSPKKVSEVLSTAGHTGTLQFYNGDSRVTVPDFIRANNGKILFDLIFVDGDHSFKGAFTDLKNVLSLLAPGGILVFDDISHPLHYYLQEAWSTLLEQTPELHSFTYTSLGRGISLAVYRSNFKIELKEGQINYWARVRQILSRIKNLIKIIFSGDRRKK